MTIQRQTYNLLQIFDILYNNSAKRRSDIMPIYNKLVRDRIPEIIENSGKKYTTKILDEDAYVVELKKKLLEEMEEYQEAEANDEALEELADVLELMHALAKVHGANIEEVEKIRAEKAIKRGGFEDKIYLIEVED